MRLFRGEGVDVPPLFVAQLTEILLRHVLTDKADPHRRARCRNAVPHAEDRVTDDGAVMAADEATVEMLAETGGFGSLGELLAQNRTPTRTVDLDVLDADNAASYWERDERHDLSVSLNRGASGAHGAAARHGGLDRAFSRRRRVRYAPSARSTTRTGGGTSVSTRRRAAS